MSRLVNNLQISSKHEEYKKGQPDTLKELSLCKGSEKGANQKGLLCYSDKRCGFDSDADECVSLNLKKPRAKNSRMAQEGSKSNVPKCNQFTRWGSCALGEKCRYVHATGGGGNAYGLLPSQAIGVEQAGNLGKMLVCRYFAGGNGCPFGRECQFFHEGGERRESAAITIVTNDGGNEGRKRTQSEVKEYRDSAEFLRKKLKTRLCYRWERTGRCCYGSSCQFAHGPAELQGVGPSNPQPLGSSVGVSAPTKKVTSNEFVRPYRKKFPFDWDNVYKTAEVYGDWIELPPRPK
ncbi:hypothetical protein T459_10500 [Capsicum annuum]|uniref:C3H1-type domain-containing protein n=1 Tax=Capsicum annuum TaxID=4072 RepID=A0A2G3A2D0_CAPAN|nr:zinc finger CCCH domain-containing protein 56 [Capsicum annuum]KAF3669199.1 hypothetical protein FXO37_09171 [Capsicum annuum]PHT88394.1 hypothetical protein T459_10500 [Capsicum annuum]